MNTVILVAICAVIALIVILVLVGLGFNAALKKDATRTDIELIWNDRRRNWLGLPWSFNKYSLSEDRLFVQNGFFKTTYDEVRLYRILDVKMTQSLGQKIESTGTISVHSSDKELGCFELKNVKNPMQVKELLSAKVEIQRDKHRVYSRENMIDQPDDDIDFMPID